MESYPHPSPLFPTFRHFFHTFPHYRLFRALCKHFHIHSAKEIIFTCLSTNTEGRGHTPLPEFVGIPHLTNRGGAENSPAGFQGCPLARISLRNSPPARGRGRGWVLPDSVYIWGPEGCL